MTSSEQYILSSITSSDYSDLAEIAILSFIDNPLYFLTYPSDVSREEIKAYLLGSIIKFPQEGKEVQTMKVVHDQTIVAFATWLLGPKPQNETPERPAGADFRFLDDIKKKINQVTKATYYKDTDWKLNMMCVLPSHQGKGLGTRLLEWGLEKATEEGIGVHLTATEKGRELYLKHGFEVIKYVNVNLREYGEDGEYTQTIMVWDKRAAK